MRRDGERLERGNHLIPMELRHLHHRRAWLPREHWLELQHIALQLRHDDDSYAMGASVGGWR